MPYVVLCGQAHTAPERIVGPFASRDDADRFAAEQPGMPDRYAVVEDLIPPDPG
jgi:hypothetical protein